MARVWFAMRAREAGCLCIGVCFCISFLAVMFSQRGFGVSYPIGWSLTMGYNPTRGKSCSTQRLRSCDVRCESWSIGPETLDDARIHASLRWGENPMAVARCPSILLLFDAGKRVRTSWRSSPRITAMSNVCKIRTTMHTAPLSKNNGDQVNRQNAAP